MNDVMILVNNVADSYSVCNYPSRLIFHYTDHEYFILDLDDNNGILVLPTALVHA